MERNVSGGAVAVFGGVYACLSGQLLPLGFVLGVVTGTVKQACYVRILLDEAGLSRDAWVFSSHDRGQPAECSPTFCEAHADRWREYPKWDKMSLMNFQHCPLRTFIAVTASVILSSRPGKPEFPGRFKFLQANSPLFKHLCLVTLPPVPGGGASSMNCRTNRRRLLRSSHAPPYTCRLFCFREETVYFSARYGMAPLWGESFFW